MDISIREKIIKDIERLDAKIEELNEKINKKSMTFKEAKPFITSYKLKKIDLAKKLEE